MTAPVRRRPGRPRKNPLPEETPAEPKAPEGPLNEVGVVNTGAVPPLTDPEDRRIGLECHPTASHVGFDDGSLYEAKDGFVVKRVT